MRVVEYGTNPEYLAREGFYRIETEERRLTRLRECREEIRWRKLKYVRFVFKVDPRLRSLLQFLRDEQF